MHGLRPLLSTWDAASSSRRVLLVGLASVVALAMALLLGAVPLNSAIARAEVELARTRLVLAIARERVADSESLVRESPTPRAGDVRTAVERVLSRHALQATPVAARTSDDRFTVVIARGRFEARVSALDALSRDEGVRVMEATLTALVDPGAVRAELAFGR